MGKVSSEQHPVQRSDGNYALPFPVLQQVMAAGS